jgi:hypothetical protein
MTESVFGSYEAASQPCDICRKMPPGKRHLHWITPEAARERYPDMSADRVLVVEHEALPQVERRYIPPL